MGCLLIKSLSWLEGLLSRCMCPQNMLRWICALLGKARHAHSAGQPVLSCMLLMPVHGAAVYAAHNLHPYLQCISVWVHGVW